ncbi:tripartite tricarboxylate transporter substrate-binding protein [Roseomonas sp. CAU 1739]|uniref:Bug family tripartite tricarboxylate transporter substrate binding protein n=1 Tax=Roseomonas sp. CAU 1739 TaxID=3140364 RepID=UPI00325B304D
MPHTTRRALLGAAAFLPTTRALAQDAYPNRPLRMILPVGPGGLTDAVGRILAEQIAVPLGRPLVPENLPGAGSTLGALALLRAPADGYALMTATNNHPVMNLLYPNFPYDPATAFAPVALAARQTFMLVVHKDVPATDMPTFLAWLRREGAGVNYGGGTPGTTNAMAGELLKATLGLDFTMVPYRITAAAIQDLVAGRMHMTIDTPTVLQPLVEAGALRALATSGAQRGAPDPSLPTLAESGVDGFDVSAWQILYARPDVPPDILARLRAAAREALANPTTKERLARIGVETWPDSSPEAAEAHLRTEVARWTPLAARLRAG